MNLQESRGSREEGGRPLLCYRREVTHKHRRNTGLSRQLCPPLLPRPQTGRQDWARAGACQESRGRRPRAARITCSQRGTAAPRAQPAALRPGLTWVCTIVEQQRRASNAGQTERTITRRHPMHASEALNLKGSAKRQRQVRDRCGTKARHSRYMGLPRARTARCSLVPNGDPAPGPRSAAAR